MRTTRQAIRLVKQTFRQWSQDNISALAAALAYYTIFSIPPMLVISLAIASRFFDRQVVQQQLLTEVAKLTSQQVASAIAAILQNAGKPSGSIIATVIGVVTLLFGASGMFGQLQSTLNRIWRITPKPGQGLIVTLKQRFFSFAMVLGIGFLLLASVIVGAALAAFNTFLSGRGLLFITIARVTNDVVSFILITLLFALIYKVIPDVKIAWRDVWIGAILTAVLFSAGKWAIGLYVTKAAPGSAYGAAGSLIVLLVWIYYSAQILYLGAELTEVYATHRGSQIMTAGEAEGLRRRADTAPELRRQDPLINHRSG